MEQKNFDPDGVGVDNGTYFGLPFAPETAELVLISAPWDVTVSYGAGAAWGGYHPLSGRPKRRASEATAIAVALALPCSE